MHPFASFAKLVVAPCLAALVVASCTSLPTSGPSANDVVEQGSTTTSPKYVFVDIDARAIETLKQRSSDSFLTRFGDYRASVEPHIGVGDTVTVTIWEAAAGGLFSAPSVAVSGDSGSSSLSSGSHTATIPEQVVGRDGAITVPYAGRVRVVGRTTQDVQTIIEKALDGKAIQPQALVNVTHSVSNSVTVAGDVSNGSRIPLSVRGDRLLSVIAAAGGVKDPINEIYVQLSRGSTSVRMPLTRVVTDPRENIFMRPDDVVALIRDPQTFLAYGATGKNEEIPFDAEGITLAEALSKAGGLLDSRSDPQGVFVFRFEPESVARSLGADPALVEQGALTPIVYRLNLRDPNSLFYSQSFKMANRDLVYVSNAPFTEVEKVVQVFTTSLSTAGPVTTVVRAAN